MATHKEATFISLSEMGKRLTIILLGNVIFKT